MLRLPGLLLVVLLLAAPARGDELPSPVSFREHVAPILVRKCLGCHNSKKAESGLSMSTFAALRKGGKTGGDLILEPGDPESSQLIELVRPGGAPRMPYKQPPLPAREIKLLERWIREGARFDGPSEAETPIVSLVDPLRDLPVVPVRAAMPEAVSALAYSPDGKTLAAAVGRGVVLFDAATGTAVVTLEGHPGPLAAVAFTPDGRTLIAAGGRPGMYGAVTAWDVAARARRFEVRDQGDSILGAAVSPDGTTLATAGYDRRVRLRALPGGKEIRTLDEHTDAVYAVAFAPDGRTLASAGADRTVKLWDVATGRRLKTLSDATAELYAVAFATGGETVMAAGVDRSIRAWRVAEKDAPLAASVFAHDAAVVRLVVSADGKTLASSGEDRQVKLWDLPSLKPRAALGAQADWPQGLAISPDGARVAVGRHDGSLAVYESASGRVALEPRKAAKAVAEAGKPALFRNATLNPPSPRGAALGAKVRMTLTGNGVGRAVSVVFDDPALKSAIVPATKPDPNRLEVDLEVGAGARVGIHRVGVVTPLGVPASQPFAVSAFAEAAEAEPNDLPEAPKVVPLPATFLGTIDRPGDVDRFRFAATRGDQLVFEARARSLGSKLQAIVTVEDDRGAVVAEASALDGPGEPLVALAVPRDGVYSLKVADADYAGSGAHFYRITAGAAPYVTDAFPLGVERGTTATIEVRGRNLGGVERVDMAVDAGAAPGSIRAVPVAPRGGGAPINARNVVVAEGTQAIETEGNDTPDRATPLAAPGGASGRVATAGDVDHFRFEARKGRLLIVEVFARRLGTALDPVIEILDAKGTPVPRAVLRPVDQTEVAFRDHDSSKPGIRLTRWNNLAIDDLVLIGREVARIKALPRNPDDDCAFWSDRNVRLGFLETTPEHHPEGQPIYKVSVHPPGTTFPAGGVPPVTLTYRNDDGGPDFSADSRVTFDPPADGTYVVRLEDVRGLGGADFGYHLVIRDPRPGFRVGVDADDPDVPRGGTTLLTARIARRDGFEGPVDVTADGLPPGVVATPARIEAGDFTANLALTADASAPVFWPPTWRLTGRSAGDAGSSGGLVDVYDPGGPAGGRITVAPASATNVAVVAEPSRPVIRPGGQVALRLSVRRGAAFAGRVPIEIRNLPQGVRVLDVGLNGVLITEKESERTIVLYAEPWVGRLERPFYAVGKAEAAATEHSSAPLVLVVEPGAAAGPVQARAAAR